MNAVTNQLVEVFAATEDILREWALEAGYVTPESMCKHYTGRSIKWLLSQVDVIPDCDFEPASSIVLLKRPPIMMYMFKDVGGRLYIEQVGVYQSEWPQGHMYIDAEWLLV